MGESFEGIEVPEGEPGGLRGAAASFNGLSGALDGVGSELRGAPMGLGAWMGPASVSYAGACLTNGGVASAGAQALETCSVATTAYAAELEAVQRDARRAIHEARDARKRIVAAEGAIADAHDAQAAAATRLSDANHRISMTGAAGVPDPHALAEHAAASGALADAQAAETRARHQLEQAREDLRKAKRDGHRAMDRAREAAAACAASLHAVDGSGTVMGPARPGAPASARTGGGSSPLDVGYGLFVGPYNVFKPGMSADERQNLLFGRGMDGVFTGLDKGGEAAAARAMADNPVFRQVQVRGYWRSTPSGGRTWVNSYVRRGALDHIERIPTAESEDLMRLSRVGKFGGPLVSGTIGGVEQWHEDAADPKLTTTDRVGRAGGVGAATAAGALGGAAIGSLVPVPVVGTAGGALIGGVAGAASVTVVPAIHDAAAWGGQKIANGATDAWDATAGARHTAGHVVHDIEPWHW